jgi:membrane protease YdiL (CAAX protease family)
VQDSGKAPAAGSHQSHWLGALLFVPVLYGGGWLLSRPLMLLVPSLRGDKVDLIGALLALILLLVSLPWRLQRAWGIDQPWRQQGLTGAEILNALARALGVDFAEELVFRGWLWAELGERLGRRQALWGQALLFGLVHPWWRLPGLAGASLLAGLILFALVLGLQRRADGGALWGAIGLHGGLVGGWFALQAGPLAPAASGPDCWWDGRGRRRSSNWRGDRLAGPRRNGSAAAPLVGLRSLEGQLAWHAQGIRLKGQS